jgi:hypothetical protein
MPQATASSHLLSSDTLLPTQPANQPAIAMQRQSHVPDAMQETHSHAKSNPEDISLLKPQERDQNSPGHRI